MPKYIDADVLADRLDALAYDDWNQGTIVSWADAFKVFAEMVRDERAVDIEPVEHGHWIDINEDGSLWECSICGDRSCCCGNYCMECVAKMDEVKK